MLALLWMLDARAERIVLSTSSDALGMGANLTTRADWNGDNIADIVATGSRSYAVWTSEGSAEGFGAATVTSYDALENSAISVVRGLGTAGGVTVDGVVLHGPFGAFGAYGGYLGPSWPSSVLATALSRYPDAWLDDTLVSSTANLHALGIPDVGRGATGEVKILDGALVTTRHCISAIAGFGTWAHLSTKATGDGVGRLFVATTQSTSTTVAWWTIDDLPSFDLMCSSVWYMNAGPTTSLEVPAVVTRFSLAQGTAARGAWLAMGDIDGVVHVHAFAPGRLDGGVTTRPLDEAYKVGTSGADTATRLVAGNLVGDDAPDLVVSNPDVRARGAAWIFEGRTLSDGSVTFDATPWRTWTGLSDGDAFGASVGAIGDIDGDGRDELVVGAPGAAGGQGEVHVLLSNVDSDGDGVSDPDDCHPDDPTRYEGATWFRDADGDGQGDPEASLLFACDGMPADAVPNATDCDDGDPAAYDGATVWRDADGDGQGDGRSGSRDSSFTLTCPWGGEPYATNALDCDDTRADVYVGGTEVCDRADNDCNGMADDGVTTTYYTDADGDGFGAGAALQGCPDAQSATNGEDCDDTRADVYPGADDVPNDALDQDCDDAEVIVTWGGGACGCATTQGAAGSVGLAAAVLAVLTLRSRRARR